MKSSRRAIFLDRDGVLNVVLRGGYVKNAGEMEWLPGAAEAVARLSASGRPVVVITNQSGIARGLYSAADVEEIHAEMQRVVSGLGGELAGLYYCPHAEQDACECRKPLPGLLRRAADDLGVDLAGSVFVGDSETDAVAGGAVGCLTVAVASGLNTMEDIAAWKTRPDAAFPSLADAVDAILG